MLEEAILYRTVATMKGHIEQSHRTIIIMAAAAGRLFDPCFCLKSASPVETVPAVVRNSRQPFILAQHQSSHQSPLETSSITSINIQHQSCILDLSSGPIVTMKTHSTSICITASVALLSGLTEGSNDFNPTDGTTRYLFTQQVSVDPVEDSVNLSSETESLAFYSDYDEQTDDSTPSVVSSSLLYDEGCLVSLTEALTCSGGDMFPNDTTALPFLDSDYEQESDDEDDEDDDDDGHSSMLSNASLRRARVTSSGTFTPPKSAAAENAQDTTTTSDVSVSHTKRDTTKSVFSIRDRTVQSSNALFARNSALSIRGGAVASSNMGSEFTKRLIVAAIVTLVYEACLGHFFEFCKVVKQTSPPGTSYTSIIQSITAEKGIMALWDGFVPWGVVQAVFKGSVFGLAYAVASSILLPLADQGKISELMALTLAGGIAGGFQGYVLSPTLLLKTRVMTNPIFREKMTLLETTLQSFRIGFDVVAEEGIGALMKGSTVFATKRVFDWSTRFLFADIISSQIRKQQGGTALTTKQKISSDLVSGLLSTLVTLPLDVIVSKTQDAKKAGVSVSAWTLFQEELKETGWSGVAETYMSGFVARLAHVCCTTVAMKTGTSAVYDAFFGEKQTST